MEKLLITLGIFLVTQAAGQNIWIGGTAGSETDWMEARNWSHGLVPGINDAVLIPALRHEHYPEVSAVAPTVGHVTIMEGAQLTVNERGVLIIDGSYQKQCGLLLKGNCRNTGALIITATTSEPVKGDLKLLENYGTCSEVTGEGHVTLAEAKPLPSLAYQNPLP